MVDLEVVGRHALFFDDDAMAAFVNSTDALVEWHSLQIDRYDVRHLLSRPPPPRKRRNLSSPSASSNETELDQERYLDLPPPAEQSDQLQPPTEKLHQIIARTAMFVSKHGGQSEIVLRVKQGDNPTFGFLMPDHNLHSYFRFLVDHQELLQSEADGKPETAKKDPNNANQTDSAGAGALSLLGSVYGNADDEDGPESKETVSEKAQGPSSPTVTQDSIESEVHGKGNTKDDYVAKHPSPPKQKTQLLKRTSSTPLFKAGISRAKMGHAQLSADADKSMPSLPSETAKVENLVVEPPSDLKSLVERLVEFIMRNGKQFEEVLIEQDRTHGRFPFLLPSNIYHPYYLKVLQEAQQALHSKKDNSVVVKKRDKKSAALEENEESGSYDMPPFDSDKKEKFKMVLGKYKKDGNDPNSSASQAHSGVTVDAAAAAAILQAATRGIRNPNVGKLLNGDGGKSEQKGDEAIIPPFPSANEEDSSEAHLTKEQKLKADRLKRAKMFVAILKSGSTTTESSFRSLSVEPQEHEKREVSVTRSDVSTISQRDKDDEFQERKSRRRSYRSRFGKEEEEEASEEERDHHVHTKKKHRSSSRKEREDDEDMDDHHRKKHRSSRGDDEDRDRHRHARKKHRSRRSSSEEEERDRRHSHKRHHSKRKHRSRHGRKHDKSSDDEEEERRYESDSTRHRKKRRAAEELEEGEISGKTSMEEESRASVVVSREASVEGRAPSLPSGTTEVSNDLRAKVRAMLMATR